MGSESTFHKLCPFCGSTTIKYEFSGSQGFIECQKCLACGPCEEKAADPICSIDAAYECWNKRVLFSA